jgi:hypothetical protein
MGQLLLASRLASIDRVVEKTISMDVRPPAGPENSLAHHSIWRTVQVHVPRARARYRSQPMVVKEKMIGKMIVCIQMLGPSGGKQNSILIVG